MAEEKTEETPEAVAVPDVVKEETIVTEKEVIEVKKEITAPKKVEVVEGWTPKTSLGKLVKEGKITNIDTILDKGLLILEPEIVDALLPDIESELLLIGQSKGKFGGGQRRVFRQTQKKTREGNKPSFSTLAVVGNKDGYVGIGYGKSKETVPAREKAIRNAKLNIFKIRRGNGCWEDPSSDPHTIPFAVEGKCGSSKIRIMPAPKGKGLVIEKECAKVLRLAGVENVWSRTRGQTKTKFNLIIAFEGALKQLMEVKIDEAQEKDLHVVEGSIKS